MATSITPPNGTPPATGTRKVINSPVPGAMIMRGPMANRNYTPLHNRIARGEVIPIEYVGVYTYVNSHCEGWTLTEQRLAEKLGKSRGYVRKALAAMEETGLLYRSQPRVDRGQFGTGGVWFVTDLRMQLQDLGITDEDTITERLEAAFRDAIEAAIEAQQKANSEPLSKNETSDGTGKSRRFHTSPPLSKKETSDPPAKTSENPRPEPLFDSPMVGQKTPKKRKREEDQQTRTPKSEDQPGAARPQHDDPPPPAAAPAQAGTPPQPPTTSTPLSEKKPPGPLTRQDQDAS